MEKQSSSREVEADVKQGSSKEEEPEEVQRCSDPDKAVVMQRSSDEAMNCPALEHPGQNKKEQPMPQDSIMLWFRAEAVQRAREHAIALQSANTYETSGC